MDIFGKSQSASAIRSRLTSNKPLRNGIFALVFALVLLYLFIDNSYLIPTSHPYSALGKTLRSTSELARNKTLGFQKIFYISLPYRDDRQDGMSLAASMTGIDLTMMPASRAEDVHDKVVPPSWSQDRMAASLGCWRSHANIWRKIINEDISTAIILEDDADWDVNIKEQMFLQSQAILSNPNLITQDSSIEEGKPYRDDWDIFFLGACQLYPRKNMTADDLGPVITLKDPYMEERGKLRTSYLDALNHFGVSEEGERVLFRASSTLCTTGYAVSKKGAGRLLYDIGWKDFGFPVDNEMSWRLEEGNLRGIITSPPIFNMFKTRSSRDSDIADTSNNEKISNADGTTDDLRNSARVAMKEYYGPDTAPEEYWASRPNNGPAKEVMK